MLNIERYGNDKSNQWFVHQWESYRSWNLTLEDKFIPRPYVSIIFHFKDCAFISDKHNNKLEPFFLAPIIPQALNLKFQGHMDTLAITCKASVISRLFTIDMSPISKRSIDLPYTLFFPLWENIAQLNTTSDRMEQFSTFINSLAPLPYQSDAVDTLYNKIIEKGISTPLKDIIQECAASKSTLLRKFVKRTGVSPKTLARIVRLDYLWTKIREENCINYQELVFHGNYFDQSHFINDFTAIIGETPGYFFKRNLNTIKLFSGMPLNE